MTWSFVRSSGVGGTYALTRQPLPAGSASGGLVLGEHERGPEAWRAARRQAENDHGGTRRFHHRTASSGMRDGRAVTSTVS